MPLPEISFQSSFQEFLDVIALVRYGVSFRRIATVLLVGALKDILNEAYGDCLLGYLPPSEGFRPPKPLIITTRRVSVERKAVSPRLVVGLDISLGRQD